MADDILGNLGEETLRQAQSIKDTVKDTGDVYKNFAKAVKESSGALEENLNSFNKIKDSASKVASIQDLAVKSVKASSKAFQEQSKLLTEIRELNTRINSLYDEAAKANQKDSKILMHKARMLESVRDSAKDLAKYYDDIGKSAIKLDKSGSIFSQIASATSSFSKISTPFEKASEAAKKATLTRAQNSAEISELLKSQKGKGLTAGKLKELGLEKFVEGKTGPAAAKVLKDSKLTAEQLAAKGAQSALGAGTKAVIGEMFSVSNLLGKAGWIGALLQVGKFIADIFIGAQNRTVEIAKSLNISRAEADKLRLQYVDIALNSTNLQTTSASLIEAQQQLAEYTGVVGFHTRGTLDNQVLLTKNLGLAGNEAADLGVMMEATLQPARETEDSITAIAGKFLQTKGVTMPLSKILSAIAKTSKEIQGYFGFSVKRLAEATLQVQQFGLSLNEAKNISNSLLDFESSISSELDLELLSQKEFNFERARAYAITGQIAKATEEVLSQMQNLTEEQRQSPILMEAASKATGLSVDQLNKAYIVQKKLSSEVRAYYDEKVKGNRQDQADQVVLMGLKGATVAEIEKTLTAQESFNAALEKAKDQFTGLVTSGILDSLVDVLVDFVKSMKNSGFGREAQQRRVDEQTKAIQERLAAKKPLTEAQKNVLEELRIKAGGKTGFWKTSRERKIEQEIWDEVKRTGKDFKDVRDSVQVKAQKTLQDIEEGRVVINPGITLAEKGKKPDAKTQDFVIQTHPKDTLALVGGTQLSNNKTVDETNTLLRELISTVKAGGNIYIGPHKLNEAIGLNLHSIT